ncbi:MAG: flagellar biosynthesis anti-sigma factor FlgM [Pseudomonadota bacterium]|nr:flagellar biosynthesis anti-sigma factor FlgM [Pseudomonadota bacterium]
MSEINTIKTTSQLALNTNRSSNALVNSASDKMQGVAVNSSAVDTVSLTDTATQLRSLQQTLADAPAVDTDRVSALKAAIEEGSYNVDPAELANNMINFEQQLG